MRTISGLLLAALVITAGLGYCIFLIALGVVLLKEIYDD